MRKRKARTITIAVGSGALAAVIVAGLAGAAGAAPAALTRPADTGPRVFTKPGVHVLPQVKSATSPWTTAACQSQLNITCWDPNQIRAAYDENALLAKGVTGKGSTIVIVDSFGSPTIQNDLQVFDQAFGIPDPPSLKVVTPAGPPPAWDPNNSVMTGWGSETGLDVEYAHTIAPGANIVLVETPTAETQGVTGFPEIVQAEQAVLDHPAQYGITGKITVISQSFSATEEGFTGLDQIQPLRAPYLDAAQKGVSVVSDSGDFGATGTKLDESGLFTTPVTGWPATDPLVTSVGGTKITQDAASGRFSQVGWNDTFDVPLQQFWFGNAGPNPLASGGGVSEFFKAPAYQAGVAGTVASAIGTPGATNLTRAIPDISMSAACEGAVTLYLSYPGITPGWHLICGTSEATPLFAGIVAQAAQVAGHPLGLINPKLYSMLANHASGLVDVTSGDNTVSFTQGSPAQTFTVKGYSAGTGYDLMTGVGTLDAAKFVPELAGY
jgi:subtilase family serine protease